MAIDEGGHECRLRHHDSAPPETALSTTSKKVQSAQPKPRSRTALRYRKEEAPDCSGASLVRYSGENGRA